MPSFDTEEIKSRVDLVGLFISRGFTLTKRGENFVTACPWHGDSRPSLVVNPKRRLWNCFGCGAAGDAISLVERFDSVDFKTAAARLAKNAGVLSLEAEADKARARGEPHPLPAPARLPRYVLSHVVTHYRATLKTSPEPQDYLRSRGLTDGALLGGLSVGYSDGSLAKLVSKQPELAHRLTERGVLNKRGNEFFHGSIVFPIFDAQGAVINLCGRNTRPEANGDPEREGASGIRHLYLTGPRRGIYNIPGVKGSGGSVILTEGILDAISLIQLGFANTTCTWGVHGFTPDILAALQRFRVTTVYITYDDDEAGNLGAERLAHRLGPHGVQTRRVILPTHDPNAFLVEGHTADELRALLERAVDLTPEDYRPKPMRPTPKIALPGPRPVTPTLGRASMECHAIPADLPPTSETAPQEPVDDGSAAPLKPAGPETPQVLPPNTILTRFGPRTYKVTLPRAGGSGMRVTIRLEADNRHLLDRFDLASDRNRSAFVSRAEKLWPAFERANLEEDLFHLIDQLEERQLKEKEPTTPSTPKAPPMSEAQEARARAFLSSKNLVEQLVCDLDALGLVGEILNKILLYLIATSRLLASPLSAIFLAGSSSGKSHIIKNVADLMPPEQVFRYTRISAQALFYKEKDALKNKLVVIEEAEGASDADYPLRVMQSDRMLTNLVTIKDPVTGQMTTQETAVEGPISLLVSSTAASIHYENATRSFELAIDESPEQTEKILTAQRAARTLEGLARTQLADEIRTRHHNAQRLLAPFAVVNNYATRLSFPSSPLRLRREHEKYLSLIEAVTFLHQHQRKKGTLPAQGDLPPRPYVKTTRADIRLANRLFASVFIDTVGELSRQSRTLLALLVELLAKKRKEPASSPAPASPSNNSPTPNGRDSLFEPGGLTRREIREAVNWSDYQLKICLEQLEELEYLATSSGRQGKRYVYALTPRGLAAASSDPDELARRLGLTDPDTLPDEDD